MPPKARRKLGYNWRARQTRHDGSTTRKSLATRFEASEQVEDINALVLPPRPKKRIKEAEERGSKRKKLSAKQRKRLMKVLEVKEKKTKRMEVLSRLSTLSLPPSQMSHLIPSTALSSACYTHCSMASSLANVERVREEGGKVEGVLPVTGWKVRRKRRRRRELRIEKELRAPREKNGRIDDAENNSTIELEGDEEEGREGKEEEEEEEEEDEEGEEEEEEEEEEDEEGEEEEEKEEEEEEEGEESLGGTGDGSGDGRGKEVAMDTNTTIKCTKVLPPQPISSGHSVFVQLSRPVEVEEARRYLPVVGEEGRVMEVVRGGAVTVLCGETGSGKTTQLPQFLYEYGYTHPAGPCGGGMIAVTEPRRVAAVSMATRVAYEMGLSQRQVSYQIRYDGNVTDETVIKFMTDGVLLKEIEQDLLLERYSVVVVDEAHERSVFTDILLGLLSRILPLREKVESRQFPVTVHFNKRTPSDYLKEAYLKVCKIHRRLPAGYMLVFVTGQREVLRLCKLLKRTFPNAAEAATQRGGEGEGRRGRRRGGEGEGRSGKRMMKRGVGVNLDEYPVLPEMGTIPTCEEWEGEEGGEGEGEGEEWDPEVTAHDQQLPMLVLPLYSLLSSERQSEIFRPVPEGVRLCVVATNIAETSITIPSIKYVVDSGKVKRRYYDKVTGISTFRVDWVSKASANQRAGRAGRTEAGHCYRLYSSAVLQNQFVQFSEPEICRRPVEDLVLQMKALGIERVANFPFPTPPPVEALHAAEKTLEGLGALSSSTPSSPSITALGRTMAQFPVAPRYAKMLALGHQHNCLPYVITLVAALSVKELFVDSDQSQSEDGRGREERRRLAALKRSWVGKGEFHLLGDLSVLLRAAGAWDYAGGREEFCHRNGLRPRAMTEVAKLRQQLTNTVNAVFTADVDLIIDPKIAPPTQEQARLLRQIVLSGLGDHVARKIDTSHKTLEDKKKLRFSYQCMSCEGPVYLHPSSPFMAAPPEHIVFQELTDTSRIYMRGVTAIEAAWLPQLVPQFCTFSDPLQLPPPHFDLHRGIVRCHVTCTYGPHCWPLPVLDVDHPPGLQRYRLFALFLLQGKVFPQLAQFSAALLLPPVTMVKNWAKLHSQSEVLLRALVDREVCSRHTLAEQWMTEPKYLLKAFSLWLSQSKHAELAAMWPPLDTRHMRHVML